MVTWPAGNWRCLSGPKKGQIGPKWDNSGTFSGQISVQRPGFVSFWVNQTYFGSKLVDPAGIGS